MAIGLETLVVLLSLAVLVVLALRETIRVMAKRIDQEATDMTLRSEQSLTSLERCIRGVLTLMHPKLRRVPVRVPSSSWKKRR